MLKVNKKSSKNGGKGSTSIEMMSKRSNGMPSEDSSKVDIDCRNDDIESVAIKIKPLKNNNLKYNNVILRNITNMYCKGCAINPVLTMEDTARTTKDFIKNVDFFRC